MQVHVILSAFFLLGFVMRRLISVSGQSKCPYERPQDEAMTCLQDMPRPDTGARPNAGPPHHNEASGQRRRRQAVEETVVEHPPTKALGAPQISSEYVDHFCSSNGTEMIACLTRVYELCEGDPGLAMIAFNPEAAKKAQSMCKDHYKDLKDSIDCLETRVNSKKMEDCIVNLQAEIQEKGLAPQMIVCSVNAGLYNCMVDNVGADCGNKPAVGFFISVMRTMEPGYCTKVIDEEYKEPVSAGIQLQLSIMSIFVSFAIFLII